MKTVPDAIADWLLNLPRKPLLLAAHVRPDGDAAGALFGLATALRDNGYDADIILPGGLPDGYEKLMPPISFFRSSSEVTWSKYQYCIALDTSNPERLDLGGVTGDFPLPIVVIDHHADNKRYGVENFVMESPAASEIVFRALCKAQFDISPAAATALLAGLIRDTGCFRFANTTPAAFESAAALSALGANYPEMINQLYFQRPLNEIQCYAALISGHLQFFDARSVAVLYADPQVLTHYGVDLRNSDALIDDVRAIRGIEIVVLIYLLENGKFKVSFRSKQAERPVSDAARALGGGGHSMAASTIFSAENSADAISKILSVLKITV